MRRVAGNLERWPPTVAEAGHYYELPVLRAGIRTLARVQRYDLPNGFYLLIGRDVQVRAQLRTLLTDALLWALVIVGAMATAGALVVRATPEGGTAFILPTYTSMLTIRRILANKADMQEVWK